jgi:hypothetical protein
MQQSMIEKIGNNLNPCCGEQPMVWYRDKYAIVRCPVCLRWKLIGNGDDIDKKIEDWNAIN